MLFRGCDGGHGSTGRTASAACRSLPSWLQLSLEPPLFFPLSLVRPPTLEGACSVDGSGWGRRLAGSGGSRLCTEPAVLTGLLHGVNDGEGPREHFPLLHNSCCIPGRTSVKSEVPDSPLLPLLPIGCSPDGSSYHHNPPPSLHRSPISSAPWHSTLAECPPCESSHL